MEWIVVVDSDVSTLQSAGQILCKQKMRMTGFTTGQTLLDFLRDNRPDVILLGSIMGKLGSFEVLSALKRMPTIREEIPVLLMADQAGSDFAANAQAMGFAGVVHRPLTSDALIARVQEALVSRRPFHPEPNALKGNTIEDIAAALDGCNSAVNGMWMGKEVFANVYRHMLHTMARLHSAVFQVLFTVEMSKDLPESSRAEIVAQFRRQLQCALGDSDILLECGENQFFLMLPEAQETDIGRFVSDIIVSWKQAEFGNCTEIASEVRCERLAGA